MYITEYRMNAARHAARLDILGLCIVERVHFRGRNGERLQVEVHYNRHGDQYEISFGAQRHCLAAAATDVARLNAHVNGFVDTVMQREAA